jgi:hypothetical protein
MRDDCSFNDRSINDRSINDWPVGDSAKRSAFVGVEACPLAASHQRGLSLVDEFGFPQLPLNPPINQPVLLNPVALQKIMEWLESLL